MLPYWDIVLMPLLEALDSGPIVEVGAATGETTVKLAELAARQGVTLHTIDPDPQFDIGSLETRFNEHFRFHRARSHDALEEIGPAASVLIDGDHNWYTVHGELTQLQKIAASTGTPFPMVILHDVEWPYARRDMYYEPSAIPDRWRKPWDRRGIRWGQRLLDDGGRGINAHLANAIEEGGPRNGVRTAVEDFIAECEAPPKLRIVHGGAGLGVLVTDDLLSNAPAVQREWDRLNSPGFLLEHTERLSEAATRAIVARLELREENRGPRTESATT